MNCDDSCSHSDTEYYAVLEQLSSLVLEAARLGYSQMYIRKALLAALVMQEKAMIKNGASASVLRMFDKTTRKWVLAWWATEDPNLLR